MSSGVLRALVTGADGFLGRHLMSELGRHGAEVTGLTRRAGRDGRLISAGSAPWPVDRLAGILEAVDPDMVFHLAGGATGSAATLEQINLGLACAMMAAMQ